MQPERQNQRPDVGSLDRRLQPASSHTARLLQLAGPFVGLALVLAIFSLLEPERFLSAYNLKTVAAQTVIVALGAMGMTFVIVSGGIDLSVGSSIALVTVVIARMLRDGQPPWLAAAAGAAAAALIGALNGVLVTGLRIVPFIVTLGMLGVVRGLAKWLAGEQKIDAPATWLTSIMQKTPDPPWLLVAPGVWLMAVLGVVMALVLARTVLGTHAYAIGSNEATARLCGIGVARTKILLYALSGLMVGLAGVMQFARLTVGDPTASTGAELDIIAAVVIGGGSLAGGEGSILGSVIGAFVMAFLSNGCNLAGVPNYLQEIIIGAIIVAAVAVDRLRQARA
jgi:ribose transport system permease protein